MYYTLYLNDTQEVTLKLDQDTITNLTNSLNDEDEEIVKNILNKEEYKNLNITTDAYITSVEVHGTELNDHVSDMIEDPDIDLNYEEIDGKSFTNEEIKEYIHILDNKLYLNKRSIDEKDLEKIRDFLASLI